MITVVWCNDFVWLQITTQIACSVLMLIYLSYVWPFESHTITKFEMLNESIILFLCYSLLCFTDWVPDAKIRYAIGWLFIAGTSIYLAINMTVLFWSSIVLMKNRAKGKHIQQQISPRTQAQAAAKARASLRDLMKDHMEKQAKKMG